MESTLSKRLTQLLEHLDLTARAFEIECGIGNGAVSKVIRTNDTNLSQYSIDKIANKYPEINMSWLTRGEGKMIKSIIKEANDEIGLTAKLKHQADVWKKRYFDLLEKATEKGLDID